MAAAFDAVQRPGASELQQPNAVPLAPMMTQLVADAALRDAMVDLEAGNTKADSVLFTIYDLGGQTVFYDLLQLLLSR